MKKNVNFLCKNKYLTRRVILNYTYYGVVKAPKWSNSRC